jgi:hypothetical protein
MIILSDKITLELQLELIVIQKRILAIALSLQREAEHAFWVILKQARARKPLLELSVLENSRSASCLCKVYFVIALELILLEGNVGE